MTLRCTTIWDLVGFCIAQQRTILASRESDYAVAGVSGALRRTAAGGHGAGLFLKIQTSWRNPQV